MKDTRTLLSSLEMMATSKYLNNCGNDENFIPNSFSRRAIRNRVWEQRINSPLFNVRIYAKVIPPGTRPLFNDAIVLSHLDSPPLQDLEDLFLKMFERFRKGEKPSHITS